MNQIGSAQNHSALTWISIIICCLCLMSCFVGIIIASVNIVQQPNQTSEEAKPKFSVAQLIAGIVCNIILMSCAACIIYRLWYYNTVF